MDRIYGSERDEQRRRALILLTDGDDTSSESKLTASIDGAVKRDVVVHSIGLAGSYTPLNRNPLKRLSEQTGGSSAFPKKSEDLKLILRDIGKRLRFQYVVWHCLAPKSTGPIKVKVDVTNPTFRKARLAYRREVK